MLINFSTLLLILGGLIIITGTVHLLIDSKRNPSLNKDLNRKAVIFLFGHLLCGSMIWFMIFLVIFQPSFRHTLFLDQNRNVVLDTKEQVYVQFFNRYKPVGVAYKFSYASGFMQANKVTLTRLEGENVRQISFTLGDIKQGESLEKHKKFFFDALDNIQASDEELEQAWLTKLIRDYCQAKQTELFDLTDPNDTAQQKKLNELVVSGLNDQLAEYGIKILGNAQFYIYLQPTFSVKAVPKNRDLAW
jgi:hypothetical protein